MGLWYWLIVVIPVAFIMFMAFWSKRYVRDMSDYLASGRVAGRYVISVGDLTAGLSVITLVSGCEQSYQSGLAYGFWGSLATVLGIIMSLTGYCVYRFRETKCLSCGQFLEMRYSRTFRIVASVIRALAEMVTNAIGPAIAVRFFIYFLGFPHRFSLFGISIPTYTVMVVILLVLALGVIWPAGRISLLITDAFQGIFCYPIFVVFSIFVVVNVSWFADVVPVMFDRAHGQSFLCPFDISELQNFNLFSTIVLILSNILNRAGWIGNDTTNAGRNAHEQKMAGVLGALRNGYSQTMLNLIGLFVIAYMVGHRFQAASQSVRIDVSHKVAQEVFQDMGDVGIAEKIQTAVSELPLPEHIIDTDALFDTTEYLDENEEKLFINWNTMRIMVGEDNKPVIIDRETKEPIAEALMSGDVVTNSDVYRAKNSYSNQNGPDTPLLSTVKSTIYRSGVAFAETDSDTVKDDKVNRVYQEFKTLYFQMMMPTLLHTVFPQFLTALFTLLMIMLLLSTDDARIFNASSALIQDVILPFRKTPLTMEQHLRYLKLCSLGVTIFFFLVSLFFAQMDFINMFVTMMCAVWLGASGPIMVGGLYTRFGNTCGAWCALIFGSGSSVFFLFANRCWQTGVYPFLRDHNLLGTVDAFLRWVSHPFNPWIDWKILEGAAGGEKFPINGYETYFISMVCGVLGYVIASLITYKKPYNLDRLLHRGIYSETPEEDAARAAKEQAEKEKNKKRNVIIRFIFLPLAKIMSSLLGITSEYTIGDKIIAWMVFLYSVFYAFVCCFIVAAVWNFFSPWTTESWGMYYFVTVVAVPMSLGIVSTVWFMTGGIIDMHALFRDLERKVVNTLDNGMVEGEVSLADKAKFDKLESQNK